MKQKILKEILKYLLILLFGALMSLNYVIFIVPNDFAPAGINGIAVMIQYAFGFSIGYMSLIINIPLCVLAYFFVDKKFAVRTLVFSLSYSLFYLLFSNLKVLEDFAYDAGGIDTVYPTIIAGLVSGLIYAFSFQISSSTGGTDVIAKFINKKWPNLNFFWIIFALNAIVAVVSCFVYKEAGQAISYKPACLCVVYCFVSSLLSNTMTIKNKQAYEFTIITGHPEMVEDKILHQLRHSATKLNAQGLYSKEGKTMLLCVVNKHQLVEFEKIIKECPDTFAYIGLVNETIGNFKKIK